VQTTQTGAGAAATTATNGVQTNAGGSVHTAAPTATAHAGGNGGTGGSNNSSNGNSSTIPKEAPPNGKFPPAFVAAVRTFASCVRSHGVPISQPNLSGHGEIFSKRGINPNDPHYRTALQACETYLIAILRAASQSHIPGVAGG
jgi:hypothetical protein